MKGKSIKTRILLSNVFIIFFSVITIQIIMSYTIRNHYYDDIEQELNNQLIVTKNIYEFKGDENLVSLSNKLTSLFIDTIESDLEVFAMDGTLISSSTKDRELPIIKEHYISKAKKLEKSFYIESNNSKSEKHMFLVAPLTVNREMKAVLRYSASLEKIDSMLLKINTIYFLVSILVIGVSSLISAFISRTIIKPLNEAEEGAKKMAEGELKIRIPKRYDDEVGSMVDTLNYMAEEIRNTEKLKAEFISSVSHELRTPLTSIKGWAMTLNLKELIDEKRKEQGINIIIQESERLSNLVDELLDFSKYQSGRMNLNKKKIDINIILSSVINELCFKAEKNGIDLSLTFEEENYSYVDKDKIKQVIINVIDNAIKFTQIGGYIRVSAFQKEETIEIIVEDNGCGISKENLYKVKKKFFKLDNKKSGSGIGLALSDEIVKLHNGDIILSSKENIGTKVKIILPICKL